jgi:prepilin-type processing-associated H-X9-DG protein
MDTLNLINERMAAAEIAVQQTAMYPQRDTDLGVVAFERHGGFGSIYWFADWHACAAFLCDTLPYTSSGASEQTLLAVADQVRDVVAQQNPAHIAMEQLRAQLNVVLERHTHVMWMGTFAALCAGADEGSADIIATYRYRVEERKSRDPITMEERADFCEWLPEYGL